MATFELPSGRMVETHEPLLGEIIHVISNTRENLEDLTYAKVAVIVPGLSREEVERLNQADGLALLSEVARIWDGPKGPLLSKRRSRNGSVSPSTVSVKG